MNNKELQFAYRVKRALDANLEHLPESTTQSLAEARRVALARKKTTAPVRVAASQFALAGAMGGNFTPSSSFSWLGRLGVAIPLLAGVMLFAGLYEHEHQQRISALAEIDAGVLSDELPLSAYLDHGFNAYLAQQGE
ncbi:DUF3619 family protein [Herbaspirillum lusitanum]|uniref:DUF3619 family protein n=1 Tax=Herbaspirillum lusitanum TaxID=213312 RepID=UPI0002D7E190|nr:DUF3619 family protein [Herbaspirillum lusitanum]MCW5299176.1 DUF3619 family protein [Herbaspirillum lusitanum]